MIPGPHAQRDRRRLTVWWIIWAAMLINLVGLQLVLGRAPMSTSPTRDDALINLVGLVPLFVSIIIRWLVLPRYHDLARAFPMFVVGLSLAEGCGILGIFLGGPFRDDVFLLGALGIAQFVPVFAKKILEPTPTGYIPNN